MGEAKILIVLQNILQLVRLDFTVVGSNLECFRSLKIDSDTRAYNYVIEIKVSHYFYFLDLSYSTWRIPKSSNYSTILQCFLNSIGSSELRQNIRRLETQVQYAMSQLARQVKRRDKHRHRRERQYNLITAILQASSPKRSKSKLFISAQSSWDYFITSFCVLWYTMALITIIHRLVGLLLIPIPIDH